MGHARQKQGRKKRKEKKRKKERRRENEKERKGRKNQIESRGFRMIHGKAREWDEKNIFGPFVASDKRHFFLSYILYTQLKIYVYLICMYISYMYSKY